MPYFLIIEYLRYCDGSIVVFRKTLPLSRVGPSAPRRSEYGCVASDPAISTRLNTENLIAILRSTVKRTVKGENGLEKLTGSAAQVLTVENGALAFVVAMLREYEMKIRYVFVVIAVNKTGCLIKTTFLLLAL